MNIRLTDHDGNVVVEGDPSKKALTKDSVKLWWEGVSGEEEYTFENVGLEVGPSNEADGPDAIFVTWTDNTQRNPRKSDVPAGVVQRVEQPLPGGGVIGPFYVTVTE